MGQVYTATATGTVTDPSGAVIPKATVTLINTGTNVQRSVTTGATGAYTISQLLPGTYTLSVTAAGFKKYVQVGIGLHTNQTAELNVKLQLGATTQSVEVTASSPLLNTQTASQSTNIETNTLANLPMVTRTPFHVVWANAGITTAFHGATSATTDQNLDRFGMNGGRTESTAILIDGVPGTTTSQWNGLYESPTLDAVAEVHLVRNSYDAQYGQSGGGVFSIVTKSGTLQFHGTAFEFLQNNVLDANNFFNNLRGVPISTFRRNQFGGALGGPIWKSKHLFFFGSYEGLRQSSPGTLTTTVPTLLERQGDFSQTYNSDGSLQTIYNPFTTVPNGSGGFTRTAFANNMIPQTLWDTVGENILALYPKPTGAGDPVTHANNWFGSGTGNVPDDHMDIRVDWTPFQRDSMFFRWSQAWENGTYAPYNSGLFFPEWGIASPAMTTPNPRGQAVYGNTITINPSFVANVLLGYGHWIEQDLPVNTGSATKIGMPAAQVAQFGAPDSMPRFNFSNYSSLGLGNQALLHHPEWTLSFQVNATKQWTKHTFKFGTYVASSYQDGPGAGGWLTGPTFSFDQNLTSGPLVVPGTTTSGNALASLLLGYGSGGSSPNVVPLAESHQIYDVYAQDSWRLTSRLTVNYGLRWGIFGPTKDRWSRFSSFERTAAAPISVPGMNLLGAMQMEQKAMWNTGYKNFMPRIGIAYRVTDKIVVRTGYGIYFMPQLGDENPIGYAANTDWLSTTAGDGIHPGFPISNPFPNGFIPALGSSLGAATGLGQGISLVPRDHANGYIQNYSFDVQYSLSPNTLVEVGYSGNQGRKLSWGTGLQANQLPAQYLSMGTQLDNLVSNPFYGVIPASAGGPLTGSTVPEWRLLVPFPQYTSVGLDGSTPGATSSYNAFLAKFTKRFSQGLNLIVNYQWSKAIDDASETQGWEVASHGARDYNHLGLERSISAHDLPQAVAITMLYQLPVGKGKAFGSHMNAVANAFVGGWQVSGLATYQSGIPINYTAPGNGFNFQYNPPNIANLHNASISPRTWQEWFNVSDFSAPAPYTIGTAPRMITQVRSDGVHNTDFSVMKNFVLREPLHLQFRTDFFNLTNSVQFGNPNTSVGSNSFGEVTYQANSPRVIQFGLKLSF